MPLVWVYVWGTVFLTEFLAKLAPGWQCILIRQYINTITSRIMLVTSSYRLLLSPYGDVYRMMFTELAPLGWDCIPNKLHSGGGGRHFSHCMLLALLLNILVKALQFVHYGKWIMWWHCIDGVVGGQSMMPGRLILVSPTTQFATNMTGSWCLKHVQRTELVFI